MQTGGEDVLVLCENSLNQQNLEMGYWDGVIQARRSTERNSFNSIFLNNLPRAEAKAN
jgi:hypothetical protein